MENGIFYITIEDQLREDGSRGLLYDHFEDFDQALAKFHTICAAAAVSGIPYHGAFILASTGEIKRQEIFDRRNLPDERFIDE